MCEFRKLLHHLNKKIAIPICFFTVLNLIYTFSGVSYSFRQYSNFANAAIMKPFILNIGNITLWLIIGLFPFFQVIDTLTSFLYFITYFNLRQQH